jgi:hypothetical protein
VKAETVAARRPDTCASPPATLQVILLAAAFIATFIPPLTSYHVLVYRLYMQLVLVAHVLRLGKTVGAPPLWPFSLPALKHWFAHITATSDSHYLLIAFMYMAQQPFLPFMISPLLLALLRFAAVVQKNVAVAKASLSPLLAQRVRTIACGGGFCSWWPANRSERLWIRVEAGYGMKDERLNRDFSLRVSNTVCSVGGRAGEGVCLSETVTGTRP